VSLEPPERSGPPESADFSTARIHGRRRRPPIVVIGWIAILGGFVALGLSGRSAGAGGSGTDATGASAAAVAMASAPPTATRRPEFSSFRIAVESFPPDVTATSEPGPVSIQATRHPSTVFVHGDVVAQQVTWVYVSVQSLDGQIGGWASVSIPGGASGGGDHQPALRFDVELAIPTEMAAGVLLVQAHAYNAAGGLVGSTRVRLAAEM